MSSRRSLALGRARSTKKNKRSSVVRPLFTRKFSSFRSRQTSCCSLAPRRALEFRSLPSLRPLLEKEPSIESTPTKRRARARRLESPWLRPSALVACQTRWRTQRKSKGRRTARRGGFRSDSDRKRARSRLRSEIVKNKRTALSPAVSSRKESRFVWCVSGFLNSASRSIGSEFVSILFRSSLVVESREVRKRVENVERNSQPDGGGLLLFQPDPRSAGFPPIRETPRTPARIFI